MRFNNHSELEGRHAVLAPSAISWVNYDDDKVDKTWETRKAARRGDELHAFAAMAIMLNQKMPDVQKTMNMYVNDAIGYRMAPELKLMASKWCFGTADSLSYSMNKDGIMVLRIHDLKTGSTRTSMVQLFIYAAIFCLEYEIAPGMILIETRIYKSDKIEVAYPDVTDILPIMDAIERQSKRFDELEAEDFA
jgi:hypothetical protein